MQAQFVWNGQGTTLDITNAANWRGQVAPPSSTSTDIEIEEGLHDGFFISGPYSLNRIKIRGGNDFTINAAAPQVITLTNGVASVDDNSSFLRFGSNINLNLSGPQTFDARSGTILVAGQITGPGSLTLVQTSATLSAAFIFNNTGAGNTYTGGTTLGDGLHPTVTVAFWNASPFGAGPVTVLTALGGKNVNLTAHGTQTLPNAFTLDGTGSITIRSWDAPLTFSGAFTLVNYPGNAILNAQINQPFITAPNNAGSVPVPGFFTRPPIVFSGGIGESGGVRTLTIGGSGIAVLAGINTYTGGTIVNGSLVLSNASSVPAVPATGSIIVNNQGYLGFLDATPGAFSTFLSSQVITAGSGGSVGVDTPTGSPTSTFSDAINLSLAGYYTNTLQRIGTATRAILTGTITPQTLQTDYQFGNGGGTLYVQSSLIQIAAKGLSLQNQNTLIPLTVYLRGSNTYTGATFVSSGFLIFDGTTALSPATTLTAFGSALGVGESYIGYTDIAGIATSAAFLSRFAPLSTWGIVGFDTHFNTGTQTYNPTITINGIDLTGFNDGVFIGTTTSANINGTLVPTTVTNGNNAANTLRFTAGQNGILTVNSTIGGTTKVMLGTPTVSSSVIYSSGTVVMNSANTYTGGTTLNAPNVLGGLTLSLGNSRALSDPILDGGGPLTITSTDPIGNGGAVGISASVPGIDLRNAINFVNLGGAPTYSSPRLYFTGTNNFTLSGNITGDATAELDMYNPSAITVSLAGNNSGFLGSISVYNGTLNLLNNNAAGLGTLDFGLSGTGTVTFGGGATAPVLYGISGDGNGTSTLIVPIGTNLTFDVSDTLNHRHEFGGTVSGLGSLTLTAGSSLVPHVLNLSGNNTYSGGTTINDKAVLVLSSNTAAGTGAVTLNAPFGGIVTNSGVTFTNSLTFTSGALMGFGTFQPTGMPTITFDTGRSVAPGVGGLGDGGGASVGLLHFISDVTFANGGTYNWALQDVALTPSPSSPGGYSLLAISGNLNITATAGGFTLNLFTYDPTNLLGLAALPLYVPYHLPILVVGGTITGFSPSAFTINAGATFQNGTLSPTVFTLSQTGNTIYLDFTPIPEPSTYALFSVGLVSVLLPVLRRRRRL